MEVTPYKISTITTTGSVNTSIQLKTFYDILDIEDNSNIEGISYVEYGILRKGMSKKNKINKRKTSIVDSDDKKKFDNQVTLEYRISMKNDTMTIVNCKIFNNGNIQMTGVKYVEQGYEIIDRIISILMQSSINVCNKDELKNTKYTIQLINCDFKIGFNIKRDVLYRIMIQTYDNMCSYEPCIYPGVKIQYMWHSKNKEKDGVCKCDNTCISGKGNGMLKNSCKKITIAVFQSGSVIITGAQHVEQIKEAYEWIIRILLNNKSNIEKINLVLPTLHQESKKKILIQKNKIVNLKQCQ